MEYGSIYGHGAYLGPDFTADYLHRSAEGLTARYRAEPIEGASAEERVRSELHANTYEPATDRLLWTEARVDMHRQLRAYYQRLFDNGLPDGGMQARYIEDPEAMRQLTAFFAWTAWTATANRPGRDYSYTNNWPPEPIAGNTLTADALTWSVISIITLLGGMGIVLFCFGRYDWLGWRDAPARLHFHPVAQIALAPAQRAVVWFFLVASVLFVGQTLVGGLSAHYRAEPGSFFGWNLSALLPYNLARTWHVQLAIFWVSASYTPLAASLARCITCTSAGRRQRTSRWERPSQPWKSFRCCCSLSRRGGLCARASAPWWGTSPCTGGPSGSWSRSVCGTFWARGSSAS